MASQGETYLARGTVRGHRDGEGLPGLWIEAFDLDRLDRVDRLGEAKTDAEGAFSITFRKAAFARSLSEALAKPGPNLLVTVRAEDGTLLHMTMPRPSASREEEFDIVIDRAPTEAGDARGPGVGHGSADPTPHWAALLGLVEETDTYALRQEGRNLSDEQIRRLDPTERQSLRSFLSLSVAFAPRVAWALTRCGVADIGNLREWPAPRVRNALAVAGLPEGEIEAESRRLDRLWMLWPEDRPEDVVTGLDIDIYDRSMLSRADWDELRRRDICTFGDWRSQRDKLAISEAGRAGLDSFLRLMSLGLTAEISDALRRAGLTGARLIARLGEQDITKLCDGLPVSPTELASIAARARARVAGIEENVVRIVREDRVGEWRWIAEAAGVSVAPPVDAFPDYATSERFGYLAYLRHLANEAGGAIESSWVGEVLGGRESRAVEPVARVTIWNNVLERARGEELDFEASYAARWRLLEARLQIARLSPFDLAMGDSNLELRLRAALVAPFAPPGRFTPAELATLEDRANRATYRQVKQRVEADPEFADATESETAAEVERRLASRLSSAVLDSEVLRYQALRRLDGRDDNAIRAECLVDPSLPPREMTTRLDEAVVAITTLLEGDQAGQRPLSFEEWRIRRSVLLWPHTERLRRRVGGRAEEGEPTTRFEGPLAEADRLLREAEGDKDIASRTVASLLDEAGRAIGRASPGSGATPGIMLLKARLGRLLLQRGAALARLDEPEARNEAAASCRAVLSVHGDPEFRDRLVLGETPAVLCGLLGQSTSRARREGDLAGLVRAVGRVVRAHVGARLSGASGAEILSACQSQVPAVGTALREDALKKLVDSLRSLERAPARPLEPIRVRYGRLIDLGEILLPAAQAVSIERGPIPRGCSPLELLLAAPLPSVDPVADHQKLAAVLKLEEIRGEIGRPSGAANGEKQTSGTDAAVEVVRDATLQLSRCSMFVRRFDQLLSAGASFHERGISATARLANEAGLPTPSEQVAFEARAQQWVDIIAAAPECLTSAGSELLAGLELSEREALAALARRSAETAFLDSSAIGFGEATESHVEIRVAPARPDPNRAVINSLDGPWHLTKVVSVARLMPADLQAFREGSPVLAFRMLSQWLDEEFPKHCDRRIEGIGVALTIAGGKPAMAGVRLWNSGTAFAVSGPDLDEQVLWRRPCLASLSAHRPMPESPRLETPIDRASFVGACLDSDWVLEISDEVESVDPARIVDIELRVEYSAYGEYGQVWAGSTRPRRTVRERLISMRRDFPEVLVAVAEGSVARFPLAATEFGGRLEELEIVNLSLHPINGHEAAEGSAYLRLESGGVDGDIVSVQGAAPLLDGIASSRTSQWADRNPWGAFIGTCPIGIWEVGLQSTGGRIPEMGDLQDLLLAITYSGVVGVRQD